MCALRPGIQGPQRKHPRPLHHRSLPRTQPHLLVRQRRSRRRPPIRNLLQAAPTGWSATSIERCEVVFPVRRPRHSKRRLRDEILEAPTSVTTCKSPHHAPAGRQVHPRRQIRPLPRPRKRNTSSELSRLAGQAPHARQISADRRKATRQPKSPESILSKEQSGL